MTRPLVINNIASSRCIVSSITVLTEDAHGIIVSITAFGHRVSENTSLAATIVQIIGTCDAYRVLRRPSRAATSHSILGPTSILLMVAVTRLSNGWKTCTSRRRNGKSIVPANGSDATLHINSMWQTWDCRLWNTVTTNGLNHIQLALHRRNGSTLIHIPTFWSRTASGMRRCQRCSI